MNIIVSTSFGILCGFVWGISYFIRSLLNFNKIVTIVTDVLFSCVCGIILLGLLFKIYNGYFRVYDIISFIIGFFIYKISLGNLFASFINNVYNRIKQRRDVKRDKQEQNTNC